MAFNPINFMQAPILRDDRVQSLAENLLKGFNTGFAARQQSEQDRRAQEAFALDQEMRRRQMAAQEQAKFESEHPEQKAEKIAKTYEGLYKKGITSPEDARVASVFKSIYNIPDTQEEISKKEKEKSNREIMDYARKKGIDFAGQKSFELFKNSLKDKQKDGLGLENKVVVDMQKKVQDIDRLVPLIEKLKKIDIPMKGFGIFSTDAQIEYESFLAELSEAYMKAKGLPSTNEALEMVKTDIFEKRGRESNEQYRKRLNEQINGLLDIRDYSIESIKSGKLKESGPTRPTDKGDESTRSVTLYKNGKSFTIPSDKVDDAIKNYGYSRGK